MSNYEQIQRKRTTIKLLQECIEYVHDRAFIINNKPILDADDKVFLARIEEEIKYQTNELQIMEEAWASKKQPNQK